MRSREESGGHQCHRAQRGESAQRERLGVQRIPPIAARRPFYLAASSVDSEPAGDTTKRTNGSQKRFREFGQSSRDRACPSKVLHRWCHAHDWDVAQDLRVLLKRCSGRWRSAGPPCSPGALRPATARTIDTSCPMLGSQLLYPGSLTVDDFSHLRIVAVTHRGRFAAQMAASAASSYATCGSIAGSGAIWSNVYKRVRLCHCRASSGFISQATPQNRFRLWRIDRQLAFVQTR